MSQEIETIFGALVWEADAQGIRFVKGRKRQSTRWDEVTRAGLVRTGDASSESDVPSNVMEGLGKNLPGLGRLMGVNTFMAGNYRQLVLARGSSGRRAIRVPIPIDDADATELIDEVRRQLGDRWLEEETDMANHYKALGMRRPWWGLPVTILFIIVLGYVVAFACAGFSAIGAGNFSLSPLIWAGMAVWLLVVGIIAYLYRRIW